MEALGESQFRDIEAAERLGRLAVGYALGVAALLGDMGRELVALNASQLQEPAAADDVAAMRLRAEHARQTAAKMIAGASRIAEVGGDTRVDFSRLLTERLAAGDHDLLDAFQAFFAVLPAHDPDLTAALQRTMELADRALGEVDDALAQAIRPPVAAVPAAGRRRKTAPPLPPSALAPAPRQDVSLA